MNVTRNMAFRVTPRVAERLEKAASEEGLSVAAYLRAMAEEIVGYLPERRRELLEEHDRLLELCRRISVTIQAERNLCLSYDEFDDYKMLEKVAKWQFEEPEREVKMNEKEAKYG